MKREALFWLLCGGIGIVLTLNTFISHGATRATPRNCLSPENQTECAEAKMTQDVIRAIADVQTAEAIPTFTPVPTNSKPVIDPIPSPLPTAEIRQLASQDFSTEVQFRDALSVWLIGSIQSTNPYEGVGIFVVSRPRSEEGFSYIAYRTGYGGSLSDADQKKYNSDWTPPRDIGDITITGATGIDGIVSFKTSTGVVGTFDLAKTRWSFK